MLSRRRLIAGTLTGTAALLSAHASATPGATSAASTTATTRSVARTAASATASAQPAQQAAPSGQGTTISLLAWGDPQEQMARQAALDGAVRDANAFIAAK